jgi:7-cyano-7-deazaguanine synthase in queuosine biosynthesis
MSSHRAPSGTQPRSLILFGGGLDSCVMVERYAKHAPILIYFYYGQKAYKGEFEALRYFRDKHGLESHIVEIDPRIIPRSPLTSELAVTDAANHGNNYIPGRNLIFSALAYSFAARHGLTRVLLGASPAPPESTFYDAKADFARSFNLLTADTYPNEDVALYFPLVDGDRTEYVEQALKTEPDLFRRSFTCYESATKEECGRCVHCQQKQTLARKLGVQNYPWGSD